MYDRNGLELSPVAHTDNAYKMTSVDRLYKSFRGYARGVPNKKTFNMYNFSRRFKDPRDAAYVAQRFNEEYIPEQVSTMHTDGVLYDVMREFHDNIEIPEWKFEAEGLTMDDILCEYKYPKNYEPDARTALVDVMKVYDIKPPKLELAKILIAEVEKIHKEENVSYRTAAKKVVNVI